MTPEDLDRILALEEPIVPSSGFATAVMEQVTVAVSAPPPLPFPWLRFLLGLAVVSALAGLCGWIFVTLPAGTYLLVRLTLSLTGARR